MSNIQYNSRILIFEGSMRPPTFILTLVKVMASNNFLCHFAGYGKYKDFKLSQPSLSTTVYLGENSNIFSQFKIFISLFIKVLFKNHMLTFNEIINSSSLISKIKQLNINLFITLLNPDIIHIQWASHLSLFRYLLDKPIYKRPKIIVSLRGRLINVSPHADPALARLYRDYLPKVDGFHAVSHAIAQEAELWGVTSDKIRVVYSGLELDKIGQFYKTNWRCNTPVYILLVGRFHWIKGYNYALDALRRLLDKGYHFHFTIIAGQPSEEILYQKNSMKLSENINILPNLSHDEVLLNMQHADILLLPSVMEGIANVVLEAMAVGLPVVSSDCGGMSEVIDNEINGLLFQNRNVAHMAEQLEKMINYSPEERERMAILARQRVTEQFGADRLGKEMIALYEEVCKKN